MNTQQNPAVSPKVSNKGRITRVDQAWDAAHREQADRAGSNRVESVEQSYEQACDENRVRSCFSVEAAWDEAHKESLQRFPRKLPALSLANSNQDANPASPLPQPATGIQAIALPLALLSSALLVAPKSDMRYYLNGVLLQGSGDEMRIVSTDGHRMLVSRFSLQEGETMPDWAPAGVIIPRGELAEAIPILSRNASMYTGQPPAIVIEYGVGHANLALKSANGFASFSIKPIDGKFPDYGRILANLGPVLAREGLQALDASAIQTQYLKGVADVAAKLGAKAVQSFIGSGDVTSVFTFTGAPDSLMVVMPMRDCPAVSTGVAKMVGEQGLSLSLAAYRAHHTRTVKLIESAIGQERQDLKNKATMYSDKINWLLESIGQAPKQIEHKKAA